MTTFTLFIVVSVLFTLIVISMIYDHIAPFEAWIESRFSRATSRPRWFLVWILLALLWVFGRELLLALHVGWFTSDTDNVTTIILWSMFPFMVENVMKSATSRVMDLLMEMVTFIKTQVDGSRKRDERMMQLLEEAEARDRVIFAWFDHYERKERARSEGGESPVG